MVSLFTQHFNVKKQTGVGLAEHVTRAKIILARKIIEQRSLVRPTDNIKTRLRQIHDNLKCTKLVQNMAQWRACVMTEVNIWVFASSRHFQLSWANTNLQLGQAIQRALCEVCFTHLWCELSSSNQMDQRTKRQRETCIHWHDLASTRSGLGLLRGPLEKMAVAQMSNEFSSSPSYGMERNGWFSHSRVNWPKRSYRQVLLTMQEASLCQSQCNTYQLTLRYRQSLLWTVHSYSVGSDCLLL